MGVLSSQVLLRPSDRDRSRRCYRDMPDLTVDMQIGQFCKRFNGRSFSARFLSTWSTLASSAVSMLIRAEPLVSGFHA